MKTTALRLYGKKDLRLESFELPELGDDEVLASVVTNTICMSDYKAVIQGADHKRVTKNIAEKPIIIGHEQCGTILAVGARLTDRYRVGTKYSIQPAVNYPGRESEAVGYSYPYTGGDATRIIVAPDIIEMNCLIPFEGESFFAASLSEPVACILAALKSQYHVRPNQYQHEMGTRRGGNVILLGGGGPMGLGFLDILLHGGRKPGLVVITDLDQSKLDRAEKLFPPRDAERLGVRVAYVNGKSGNLVQELKTLAGGAGYDDVFAMAPVAALVDQASAILAPDGCLNFFTGPTNPEFKASFNFYNVHYYGHHVMGSVGSYADDMFEALDIIGKGIINPAAMITHVGGLDAAAGAVLGLPEIPGGKKLIYTGISLPLTPLEECAERGTTDPLLRELAILLDQSDGLWSKRAEEYLLAHGNPIGEYPQKKER
jgi:threonine dehydrogenase-like Zn-dependent dehydrogenase